MNVCVLSTSCVLRARLGFVTHRGRAQLTVQINMKLWIGCLSLFVLADFICTDNDNTVFWHPRDANAVLVRPKRANWFLLEEILQGNLERECYEEHCSYEEAREVFENIPETNAFWTVYYDGDQCKPNPCLHGGTCTDQIGFHICNCTNMYRGVNCERDVSQCEPDGPLSCDHFCQPLFDSFRCSCATGYTIHSDGRTCLPQSPNSCGRAPVLGQNNISHMMHPWSNLCPHKRCPWQVSLTDEAGEEFCSGVILGARSVLTTASCISQMSSILVATGSSEAESSGGQVHLVSEVYVHEGYKPHKLADDLAFLQLHKRIQFGRSVFQVCIPEKDFSENVLMKEGRSGLMGSTKHSTAGNGAHTPYYMPLELCRSRLNHTLPLTNKMFCTNSQSVTASDGDTCNFLPGTPIVSVKKNTVFLTGLLITSEVHNCSLGYTFIKLSRYVSWIQQHLKRIEN